MGIILYMSSTSANSTIRGQQQEIINYLESQKIPFEKKDVCEPHCKEEMLSNFPEDEKKKRWNESLGRPVIAPPQIFNEEVWCGDYNGFFKAKEEGLPCTFLKIPLTEKEEKVVKELQEQNITICFNS